jgi:hypothetical protein
MSRYSGHIRHEEFGAIQSAKSPAWPMIILGRHGNPILCGLGIVRILLHHPSLTLTAKFRGWDHEVSIIGIFPIRSVVIVTATEVSMAA